MTLILDRKNRDPEQVREFMPGYLAARNELGAAPGALVYDADLKGRIPGIEGPDEETAIYYLQTLHKLDALQVQIDEYLAEGGEVITHLDEPTKFRSIVRYGWYVGGTGWQEWSGARLCPNSKGVPSFVLPKGSRTRGHSIDGSKVMVKR